MVERDFIESIPILNSNGSGGGDHIRKLSATPTTHVIRGIRGRWHPKLKAVSGLMPAYWLPMLLLFVTLTIVMVSACLVIRNLNRSTNIDAAPATTSDDEQVLFQHIYNDVNTLSVAQFSEYISHMAKTYKNMKFKIFFLKDDINYSFSIQIFSDIWAFMGLKDGNDDITPDNVKAIQELHNNHSNVKIIIKRLSNYVPDKCWRYRLRQIQPISVPFFLRVYSMWRYGGIAMDLLTYNQIYRFGLNDLTANKVNQILEFNNIKAAGPEQIGQVLKFDSSFFEFLSNFIEVARVNFMPIQIGGDINKTEKNDKTTENKSFEKVLAKRSAEPTLKYTIAPKNKINDVENHAYLTSNASARSILESAKNITSFKEPNETTTKSKLILALVRTNSYLVGPQNYEDYDQYNNQVPTGQVRDDIYIDLTGKFVAADRPHHPFLANILASSANNNLSPVKAITNVLTAKCGGKFKCPYCKTVYYF